MSKLRKGITSGRDHRAPEETRTPLIQAFLDPCSMKGDHMVPGNGSLGMTNPTSQGHPSPRKELPLSQLKTDIPRRDGLHLSSLKICRHEPLCGQLA